VAVTVLILQVLRQRRNVPFFLVMVGFALLGIARMVPSEEPMVPSDLSMSTGARITVESLPRSSSSGVSVLATVRDLDYDGRRLQVDPFTVLVTLSNERSVAPGDVLAVVWSAEPVEEIDPGYARYVRALGASATGRAWWFSVESEGSAFFHTLGRLKQRVADGLQEALPGDAGALAAGIVTGDDSHLSNDAADAFLNTGTSHITAVSGSNVAMVLAIWNLVIPAGRNRRMLAVQALVIVSIWLYALLVGMEPPALRAAIMASLVLLGSRFGRRPDLLTLLALTSAGMVLWNPDHVRMAAFWLSIVATGAIIMRMPSGPETGRMATVRGVVEGIGLAQLATLPIILTTFGTWSLTSVLANGLLTPIMWLAFPMCFVLAGMVLAVPAVAPIASVIPLVPLEVSLQIVRALGETIAPLDVNNMGAAGIMAVALPCMIALSLLAHDTQRWFRVIGIRWNENPAIVAAGVIGPAAGAIVALLVVVFRA
jgi:ComEC/Rec2-related protein